MGPMTASRNEGEAISKEGLADLKRQLHELETAGRRAIAARILAARALGDLKENAEYHIAKEDQAHLETKILRLRERLRNAAVVEVDAGGETVTFGRTAEILDQDSARVHTWTIVGGPEADLAQGKLSAAPPVARPLLRA